MVGVSSNKQNTTVINNYYGCAPGGGMTGGMPGGMGMGGPMSPMMMMMQMMMKMMQMMMGGGSQQCMPGQYPGMGGGMPGMGGGMPGMGGGMPGMCGGMPGMGGMPQMGGFPGMNCMPQNPMQQMMGMMGNMMGALSGMLGNQGAMGGCCCPPPCQMGQPPMCGAMAGAGGPRPMGRGGLRVQGDTVTTPGGYQIKYSGTTVDIQGMGGKGGGSAAAAAASSGGGGRGNSMAGAFAMSGPNGSMAGAFAFSAGGWGGGSSAAAAAAQGGYNPTGHTKIHGDPHVDETGGNKGGKDKETWDWKEKDMSFNLPDGTKITMNADGPKGVVKSIDIYNGNDHVHGEGGKFQGGVTGDGFQADARQKDGDSVYASPDGNVSNWYRNPFGMGQEISQQYKK